MKKKSLKKAAVLAIAGAMAVTSLAACGGSGSGKDSEGGSSDSLTMAWWGNQSKRTVLSVGRLLEQNGNLCSRKENAGCDPDGYVLHSAVCR